MIGRSKRTPLYPFCYTTLGSRIRDLCVVSTLVYCIASVCRFYSTYKLGSSELFIRKVEL